jgi:hypothetical protein
MKVTNRIFFSFFSVEIKSTFHTLNIIYALTGFDVFYSYFKPKEYLLFRVNLCLRDYIFAILE